MAIPRGLDHLIHVVRDLDAAGAAYARLGFQVGPENRHPFGTKNRIVQLPGFFIEILAVGDHAPIPEHGPRNFSFAAFQRDRLARAGEGGSGLVLESRDARADAAAFAAANIGDFEPFFFERREAKPDGTPTHVAFELAFAADAAIPDVAFFTCEQKYPESFWNADAQVHPNGAGGVAGAIFTAENPSDHHVFLSAFAGLRDFRASSAGLVFATPRGEIEALTGEAFAQRTGQTVLVGPAARLAALRVEAPDLDRAGRIARERGASLQRHGGVLVVHPPALCGLTLVLETPAASRADRSGAAC